MNANQGYYPNFAGKTSTFVNTQDANFSCTYNMGAEIGFVAQSNINVINDVPPKPVNSSYQKVTMDVPFVVTTLKDNVVTENGITIPKYATPLLVTSEIKDSSGNILYYGVVTAHPMDVTTTDYISVTEAGINNGFNIICGNGSDMYSDYGTTLSGYMAPNECGINLGQETAPDGTV
jgi:hypothetical protein